MRKIVAVVICGIALVPAGASASVSVSPRLLRDAAHVSGLHVRAAVRTSALSPARYGALFSRAWSRQYPSSLQQTDASVFRRFGLVSRSVKPRFTRAWYDVAARRLYVQRRPVAGRRTLMNEYVRALIDQNYRLRRLLGLRARDRDRWLAANAIVDGTAALASGLRSSPVRGTPLDRFTTLESNAGLGPGRALAAQLRYLGGRTALASALRTFPQTTEQLLHVDKFLERERALPVRLPDSAVGKELVASETFGELDVRTLLQAFKVPLASATAEGWGGGRFALYGDVAVVLLRWDTPEDAAEWQAAAPRYVAAAFPGASAHTCPPLDRCWSGPAEIAAGVYGTTAVLASGPGAAAVAAALL
ncbi:MAG TPA: hypothetical protein VNR59_11650 [Gaiellaceae bacterium]|nr:hypothetical protein [Gaiellaceae bacterium]